MSDWEPSEKQIEAATQAMVRSFWEPSVGKVTEDHRKAAKAALAAADAAAWRPIEEAPKDGSVIVLWGRYWSDGQGWFREPLFGHWHDPHERWEAGAMHEHPFGVRPTHFRPLPAPPRSEDSDT